MTEWWKYRISDFLLFSPRTYYRMIEHYNEALWPAQVVTLLLGAVIIWLLYSGRQRIASSVVAGLWVLVATAFLWKRYTTINWAATYFAWLFVIEALLLITVTFRPSRDVASKLGVGLFVLTLMLYPLVAPLFGRGWRQAEIFGVAPDPTVLATLGLLVLANGPLRWWVIVVPILWCLFSGALLWAMGAPEALLLGLAPVVVVTARRLRPGDYPAAHQGFTG